MDDVVRTYIARLQEEATAAKHDLDAARLRLESDLVALGEREILLSGSLRRLRDAIADDDAHNGHELKPSPRWW